MRAAIPMHDRVIEAMNVRVGAFAVLNLSPGYRLCFGGSSGAIVHFVLTGRGLFEFDDAPALPVMGGDIVIVPSGGRKTVRTGEGASTDVWLADRCETTLAGLVQVDAGPQPPALTVLCGSVGTSVGGEAGLFAGLTLPIHENLRSFPFAGAALAQLRSEVASPAFATYALASALMKACLILVVRKHIDALLALHGLLGDRGDRNLRRAITHVVDRPSMVHSVASLALVAGMSRTAFARTFAEVMGTSPLRFVTNVRLRYAENLLLSTNLPIKAIAASVGLSRSHFSRAFRNAHGQDPLSFRAGGGVAPRHG